MSHYKFKNPDKSHPKKLCGPYESSFEITPGQRIVAFCEDTHLLQMLLNSGT